MKRISTLAVAALLAVSMSAFADNTTPKPSPAECQKKDAHCTKKCTGDQHNCPKHDANSCPKSSDKKS